ncbi:hypothetical protein MSG28_001647 [Choristoneura fumiferana]|uniref:Uncharacterized protein n=1 Tax=Choristoneura fumiferana TaxID=7141 RepID=A0ACC0KVA3_CHOFU|nr:hypothetical protein MSG28_001647 [Choristoneura fumiferana]
MVGQSNNAVPRVSFTSPYKKDEPSKDLKVLVAVLCVTVVRCAGNATSAAVASAKAPSETIRQQPGALASFGKMLIDIPLGIVEACKDGVAAIEKTFLAIVRGIF